ncbi:MAG TPA: penicillin-binding protein 2 [Pyrinomonadaceae bacterium]|nr:penicillin-binding protein 2 [Pyrinomonadaceae bacterium]
MKFVDDSQNLRIRLRLIQVLVLVMLGLLAVRLYVLQVVNGSKYAEVAVNQRIRRLPIPAPRGVIFDRDKKILVDSRPIYSIILSREDTERIDRKTLIQPLSQNLDIDPQILRERFDQVKTQRAFESILIKEEATQADIAWVEGHQLEFPALRIEQTPQRRYPANGFLAHVLGYVQEISPQQLEDPRYQDYKPGDIIGQEGIEAVYDEFLRGRDGYREVIVDSRGHIQSERSRVEPQSGQDMVLTIDSDLQFAAEEELRKSPQGRGVIIAMDPNNGELFALASAPSFDPNLFSQRITTKEGRAEYQQLLNHPDKPLLNRAVQGRYPPGSTWKPLMAIGGLQQGAITIADSHVVCGGGITIGNRFTRCMGGNHGSPDVHVAIMKSCDGYFYRLGLKMKLEGMQQMVREFELDKRSGIDLPHEIVSITPSRELKAKLYPKTPDWTDIDTIHASFGQGQDVITPIALLRAHSAIGMKGKLYVPHLLKELLPIGAVGERPDRPARFFDRPQPRDMGIDPEQNAAVIQAMWGVVNETGTATGIKMAGFDIAGKTGTAQVVSLGKEGSEHRDHSWFVSYAPAFKPEISVVALIENAGLGSRFGAPSVRAVYDVYYQKKHAQPAAPKENIAMKVR